MNQYLKNNICNFELLFDYNDNIKYNLLSTCFFKMSNHYKNFNVYINGLKRLIKLLESQNDYMLRIFIDEHIKSDLEIYNILKSSKKVQIVVFKCTSFIINNYHIDVFGALVRLFPVFNFINNDSKDVIVIDIDLNDEDIIKLKKLITHKTEEKEIIGMGTVDKLLINKIRPHFYCGLIGFYNNKYDSEIITNFINNASNIKDKGLYGKREKPYGYGTDELFLNEYFIFSNNNSFIKNVSIGILLNYDINWFLYQYKKDLIMESSANTNKNLKLIVGKFYKPNMSNEQMFNLIDKFIYQVNSNNPNKIYISKQFYELIKYLNFKNLEWFDLDQIKLIYKYFNNIIDCLAIIYFNTNNLDIYDVKLLK